MTDPNPRRYGVDARVVQDHFPGIGRYVWNTLQAMLDQLNPDEQLVIAFDPNARNTRYDWQQLRCSTTAPVEWMPWATPIFSLRALLTAPMRDVQLIHHTYFLRPLRARPPSVTSLYDAIPLRYPDSLPSARARWAVRVGFWLASKLSTQIVTLSSSAAEDLLSYFPYLRGRVVVVPGAPDPVFRPMASHEAEAHLAQRLTQVSQPFALYLASNKPHKNLPRLVEAWRIVVATLGDRAPRLVIAGHYDPRYPEAQQLVSALGLEHKVVFVGLVSDAEATALYSTCALFVFPSLYEGFGLTPLEAMACGAPVACSNTSSLPEVVGDAAVLFDPHRADDIAAACLRVLTDETLQANLRQASLRQAARFSWREAAARTLEVYRAIAR
ncbi:MAG: glycosyltransferase family 1 protein [Anaerolineae bacterium]|nr:glycosyltransferase family 1 protein [Anaerolineae bacterium]